MGALLNHKKVMSRETFQPWRDKFVNLLQANVPFLSLLKASENQRFSDVFRGYRDGILAGDVLKWALSTNKSYYLLDYPEHSSDYQ